LEDWWFGLKEDEYTALARLEKNLKPAFEKFDKVLITEINRAPTQKLKAELFENFQAKREERRAALMKQAKELLWSAIVDINTDPDILAEFSKRKEDCDSLSSQAAYSPRASRRLTRLMSRK
jgi:hypothetical protein